MARDLNEILSELEGQEWKSKLFGDSLLQARNGDWEAVADVAGYLGIQLNRYYKALVKELFQWLVDKGHGIYFADLCHIEHRLDPSLPYTETDVKLLLPYCEQGGHFVFGLLVKALLSDTSLFNQFKDQVLQLYKLMTAGRSDVDLDLKLWYDVLILDKRMNYPQEERKTALLDMEHCLRFCRNPYVAVPYLEEAVRRNQLYHEDWEFDNALSCLSCSDDENSFYFYKGLCALCTGQYEHAFDFFRMGWDERNYLASAYCLIHGMGTPIDHTAAREILKDYPDNGFALYLLAVSLFRTADHPKELSPEVIELMEEAKRLGYKAAESTLDQMKLICCLYASDVERYTATLEKIKSRVSTHYSSVYALNCFYAYLRIVYQVAKTPLLGSHVAVYSFKKYLSPKEFKSLRAIVNIEVAEVMPLTAFSRALMRTNIDHKEATEDWITGLYGFNQSPTLRKWAVEKALIDMLFEGYSIRMNYVLQLLQYMGRNEKKMLLWNTVLHISEHKGLHPFHWTLENGFLDLFGAETKDPLIRLLRAAFSYRREPHLELLQTLWDTAELKDNLLIELRNKLIHVAKLEGEIPLIKDQSPINETNEDLLLHTVGYAFFDYNF